MFRDDYIKEHSLVYINRGAERHSFIFFGTFTSFMPQFSRSYYRIWQICDHSVSMYQLAI